jgi:Ala-tRNA(Pro) deacylase
MMATYDRIVSTLQSQDVPFRVVEHEPEGRCDVVSEIRGNALSQAMKAIVIMAKLGKKERRYYLAVVPGDCLLDMEAIKSHAGASSVMFAPAERAKILTECEMGAVPPFSFHEELRLIVDPSITANSDIVFNAGRLDQSIFMATDDYIKTACPTFVRIVK